MAERQQYILEWKLDASDVKKEMEDVAARARALARQAAQEAAAAGTPQASADLGAIFASLRRQILQFQAEIKPFTVGIDTSAATAQLKAVRNEIQNLAGIGGDLSGGRHPYHGVTFQNQGQGGRQTVAAIVGPNWRNLNPAEVRRGFQEQNDQYFSSAFGSSGGGLITLGNEVSDVVGRRLAAIRESLETEKKYAARSAELIPLVAAEANLRRERLAAEKAATARALRDNAAFIGDEASAAVDERIRKAATRRREADIFESDDFADLRTAFYQNEGVARAAEARRKAAVDRAVRESVTQADILDEVNDTLAAERARLEMRLRVATAALGENQEQLRVEKSITALKGQVRIAEERRAQVERQEAEKIALATGRVYRASDFRTGRGILVPAESDPGEEAKWRYRASAELRAGILRTRQLAEAAGAAARNLNGVSRAVAPTRFQQLYARIMGRQGHLIDPGAAPRLGQFVGQRALTTATYGLTGGLLYGGIAAIGELIREATELETQLGIVEAQFVSFGGTINDISFEEFREEILAVSRDTGVAADATATSVRQLAGALATVNTRGTDDISDDVITPNVREAPAVARIALGLSQITGLPQKEITDSFSATLIAFQEEGETAVQTAQRIADAVVGLEAEFGVASTEVLNFTASLASLGAESGFTVEQLAAFGAVVEQAVGSDVAAAENMGRIFASLKDKSGELFSIFQENGLEEFVEPLVEAFGNNDMPAVLEQLVRAYQQIGDNRAAQADIATLIGDPRQARTFFAVLARGQQVIAALNKENGDFGGQFDERFARYQQNVKFSFAEMQRAVEEFGLALFEAGLADALVAIADAATLLAGVGETLLGIVTGLNEAFGGLPAKLLGVYAALRIVSAGGGALGGLLGGVSGGAHGGSRGAGLLGLAQAGLLHFTSPNLAGPRGRHFAGQTFAWTNRSFLPGREDTFLRQVANRGGVGGRVVAGLGNAAPFLAGLALYELNDQRSQTQAQLDEQANSLRQRVAQRLAEGVSASTIRQRALGAGADSLGLNLFEQIGSIFINESTPIEEIDAELLANVDVNADYQARLEAVQAALRRQGREGDVLQRNILGTRTAGDTADELLRAVQDGTANLTEVEEFIARFAEDDAALSRALADIDASEAERNVILDRATRAVERINSGEAQLSVEQALANYQAGSASLAPVIAAIDRNIENLQQIIDAAGGVGVAEQQAQKLEELKQRGEILAQAAQNEAEIAARMAAYSGQDDGQFNVDNALALYERLLNTEGVSRDTMVAAAYALADAEQQAFLERVENTESAAERLRMLDEGFDYSEVAQRALVAVQLSSDSNMRALETAGEALGIGLEELTERIITTMIENGVNAQAALELLFGDLVSDLGALRSRIFTAAAEVRAGTGNFSAIINEVNSERNNVGQKQRLITIGGGLDAELVNGRASDAERRAAAAAAQAERERAAAEAKQKADEARREQQAQANARLSILEAQARGDAVALARIAQQRARLNYQFAETESERLEAQAQMIAADNQLREAFLDINAARRELTEARTGDDPLVAARNAVAAADEAIANASGEAQRLRAQAERIRAEQNLAEAIREIAESQIDILIAMAEASGDSVEAARLNAQKIRERLANANALGLNQVERNQLRAELIAADAAVRDAQLAEERATIDYQLEIGQITKGQAVAALQSLLTIPNLTEEQIREINLEIRNLRNQLGQDYQFNLPTQLGLPTVYEVRRLGGSGGTGSAYQDNRQISVTVNANTNASPEEIAATVAAVVGEPNRSGTSNRRY